MKKDNNNKKQILFASLRETSLRVTKQSKIICSWIASWFDLSQSPRNDKKINTDFKYLISIWILLLLAIIPTYAHHGNLVLDCGREVYYPTQVMLGKVLYKDLFNIYGPFAYMFNALLFKIFSVNLNVLYISGCICAYSAMTLIYLISKRFLSKFLSFSIVFFTICTGILSTNLFNFIFPYSYGMLYGIVAFLASVLLLLKYEAEPDKTKYLYLSSFLAGLAITSKYEFLPYLIVLLYAIFKIKPLNLKEYLYTALAFLIIPVSCFGILFLQGLRFDDLINAAKILQVMAQTKTLNYFYITQGVCFSKQTLGFLLLSFIKTIIPLIVLYFAFRFKNKFLSWSLGCFAIFLLVLLINPASFAFLPVLIGVLVILKYKTLIKNKSLMLLVLSGIAISLKSFWGLATLNYGIFFVSFLFIVIFALLKNKLNIKAVACYVLFVSVVFAIQNISVLKDKNFELKTNRGRIYITEYFYKSTNNLIKYINKNTKKTDKIAIFPEGMLINFLTDRKTDDFCNSLIPLYVETFGEQNIIEYFKKHKPDYIIFNNWQSKDYYFEYICKDYAVSFCEYVANNYSREKTIDKGFRYLIFKLK